MTLILISNLKKSAQGVPEILLEWDQHEVKVTLNFDQFNSNQSILKSRWMFAPNLKKLPPGVDEILRSREWTTLNIIPPTEADDGSEAQK